MTISRVWIKFKGCEIGELSNGGIYVCRPGVPMQMYTGAIAGGVARNAFCNAIDRVFRDYITKKIEEMGYDPVTGVRDHYVFPIAQTGAEADGVDDR